MIYQPRIEQSDWSKVTSHGTMSLVNNPLRMRKWSNIIILSFGMSLTILSAQVLFSATTPGIQPGMALATG